MDQLTFNQSAIEAAVEKILEIFKEFSNSSSRMLAGQKPIEVMNTFQSDLDQLKKSRSADKIFAYIERAISIAAKAKQIAAGIENADTLSDKDNERLRHIRETADILFEQLDLLSDNIGKLTVTTDDVKMATGTVRKLEHDAAAAIELLQDSEAKHKKRESELLELLDKVQARVKTIEKEHEETLDSIKNLFAVNEIEIKKKQSELNQLYGIASGTAFAGGYAGRAEIEETTANRLRIASLIVMTVVIGLIGDSLYGTTLATVDWRLLLYKLILSVMLSVPAAYLARESARHRSEHQFYLSKALDVNAIDNYIASLPDEAKHSLKAKAAERFFSARKESSKTTDNYPLNINELLVKLLDKADLKNDASVDKKGTNPSI